MKKLICYKERANQNFVCKRTQCKHWINDKQCVLSLQMKTEKITVNEISNLFALARTKICQLEDKFINDLQLNIM